MPTDSSRNALATAAKEGDCDAIRRLCRRALARGDVAEAAAALRSVRRALETLPFDRVRVLLVSSSRPDLLADAMTVGFLAAGFLVDTSMVANLDMAAAQATGHVDVVVLCAHAEDVLQASRVAATAEERASLARETGAFIADTARLLAENGFVLCCEITPFSDPDGADLRDLVVAANAELAQRLPAAALLLTNAELADASGEWLDPRLHAVAGTPYSQQALAYIAYRTAGAAAALAGRAIKLVVTDLDGTLWPGVIAEDGIAAALKTESEAHRPLRSALAALAGRGIVLAAATHNDKADAEEALAQLQDGTLSPRSFVAIEAGWEPKPVMIGRLLAKLDLGAAATMIVDDDPVRCAEIQAAFPQAEVRFMDGDADAFAVEIARDPLLSASPFRQDAAMDRTKLYEIRARAEAMRPSGGSLDEFYRSLDMRIAFADLDEGLLPRAFELTRRTNQFNATGWRPALAQLQATIGDPAHIGFLLHLRDRFGDHGWVGLVLAAMDGSSCRIEGFYLSCRALGRGVETAMLAELARRSSARGARDLVGDIALLPRNQPVRDLYGRHVFAEETPLHFRRALSSDPIPPPTFLKVER